MSLNVEVKIDVILHATESQEKIFDSFKENFGLKEENFKIKTKIICCYPTDKNFINAHTKEIKKNITFLSFKNISNLGLSKVIVIQENVLSDDHL